jgi:multiple sugar transport system permease protein
MTNTISVTRLIRLAVLSFGALIFLAPYIFMVSTAGKAQSEIFSSSLSLIPEQWSYIENFSKALSRVSMTTLLFNGVVVCALIFVIQIVVAIPCAYAMAKLKFRAARTMMVLVMLGLLVPIHATALPIYVAFDRLSVLNSYAALVAPFSISVFAIFPSCSFSAPCPTI